MAELKRGNFEISDPPVGTGSGVMNGDIQEKRISCMGC